YRARGTRPDRRRRGARPAHEAAAQRQALLDSADALVSNGDCCAPTPNDHVDKRATPALAAGGPFVEILYFDGCPNHHPAIALVERISRELGFSPETAAGQRARPAGGAAAALPRLADHPRRRRRRRSGYGGARRLRAVLPHLPHRGRRQRPARRKLGARRAVARGGCPRVTGSTVSSASSRARSARAALPASTIGCGAPSAE